MTPKENPRPIARILIFSIMGMAAITHYYQNPELFVKKSLKKPISLIILASLSDQPLNEEVYLKDDVEPPLRLKLKVKKPKKILTKSLTC